MAAELGIKKSTVHRRLKQLDFVHKKPRQDEYELTEVQANRRIEICHHFLRNPLGNRFWKRILTSDEKWASTWSSTIEISDEFRKGKSHRQFQNKIDSARKSRCAFSGTLKEFDLRNFELVPNGQAISAEIYCQQLERVCEKLEQKYLALII